MIKEEKMTEFEKIVHVAEICHYCVAKYLDKYNPEKDMWDMGSSYLAIFNKWERMVYDFNFNGLKVNENHVGYITEWLNAEENQDFIIGCIVTNEND